MFILSSFVCCLGQSLRFVCSRHVKKRGILSLSYLGDTCPAYSLAFNGSSVDGSELLLILRQAYALSSFALEQLQSLRFVCSRHVKKKRDFIPLLFGRYVTRTRDPHNVDVMRYQLRQSPIFLDLFQTFGLLVACATFPPSFRYVIEKRSLANRP